MGNYQRLQLGQVSVEYIHLCESPDAPTIVLLHEGLGCVALWRDFPRLLQDRTRCNVVAYSRLGYGGSDPISLPRPLDHMRVEARDFLPQFFAKLALEKPILLGHSDGATIALEYAIAYPNDVSALILLAPHVFVEDFALRAIEAIDRQYRSGGMREKLKRYHGSNVDTAFRGWCDTWLNPGFKAWNMESDLNKLRAPILQFQGNEDEYGSAAHVRSIAAHAQAETQTNLLEACGHAPHLECSDFVLTAVANFLPTV